MSVFEKRFYGLMLVFYFLNEFMIYINWKDVNENVTIVGLLDTIFYYQILKPIDPLRLNIPNKNRLKLSNWINRKNVD